MPLYCQTSIAKQSDFDELLPLIHGYQAFYSITHVSPEQTRSFFLGVIESKSEAFMVVARVDARIIGFATGYVTRSGYLAQRLVHMGDLFVDPTKRRKGIGRELIQAFQITRDLSVLELYDGWRARRTWKHIGCMFRPELCQAIKNYIYSAFQIQANQAFFDLRQH